MRMRRSPIFKLVWLLIWVGSLFLTVGASTIGHQTQAQPEPDVSIEARSEGLNGPPIQPNLQQNPTLSLNPSVGSASNPITAFGENWLPGNQVTLEVLDGIVKYGVGGAKVGEDGRFLINFFMPAHMRTRPLIIVRARTVVGTVEGAAMAEAGFGPEPIADLDQGTTVTTPETAASTPTSAPMAMTPEEQAICEAQQAAQQAAANMSLAQSTALTLAPVAAPVCTPSQWSGCGNAGCAEEYVSQCQPNGTWGECVWDPGFCGKDKDGKTEEEKQAEDESS